MKSNLVMPLKVVSTSFIAASLLFSSHTFASVDSTSQSGVSNVEQYLKHLTKEDRNRVHSNVETAEQDKYLSPKLDTTSNKPVGIIVQFAQDPAKTDVQKNEENGIAVSLEDAKNKVEKSHQQFKNKIGQAKKAISTIQIRKEYRQAFNGVAMTVPANEVHTILAMDEVKAVFEDKVIKIDPSPTDIQTSGSSGHSPAVDSADNIGATKLHEEGITGKGVKVAVLDTGIDYHHPDLKGVYRGGYDFVNNDTDPMETTYDDWKKSGEPEINPLGGSTYYTSHGTHVSGTIAGQGKNKTDYAVTGVAPGVDLYAYKVLGPYGSGYTSNIIAGIEKAVADGMDVINLSLGSNYNDPLDPNAIAINNAALAGTTAVIAAGNSGSDLYSLGSPGTSPLAITVGASDFSMTIPTATGTVSSNENLSLSNLKLLAKSYDDDLNTLKNLSLPIVFVGLGNRENDYNGKDVNGKIALIERGVLSLNEKVMLAKKHGAKAVLIYNNNPTEGQIPHYLGNGFDFIPSFTLTNDQGIKVVEKVNQGNTTFTLNSIGEMKTNGDTLADFSSRGPSNRLYDIKPEVTAPGVAVFSSVPAYENGPEHLTDYTNAYLSASGTSMATPHVAGATALLLQEHPEYKPEDVKAALMNTADRLQKEYSVFEVGAGRIDVYEAVHSDVHIKVLDKTISTKDGKDVSIPDVTGALSFGPQVTVDKAKTDSRVVSISNTSNKKKTFTVQVKFNQNVKGAKDALANNITLDVPNTVTINANKTIKIKPTIHIPATAEFGNYEGYIYISNNSNPDEVYQLPFGFKHLQEGINTINAFEDAFTTRRDLNNSFPYGTGIEFSLNSSMETVDFVLKDAKTGQALGLVDAYEGLFTEDTLFFTEYGFNGLYSAFTGHKDHPISYSKRLAPPGKYEIELIATNRAGKTFKKSDTFYIENTNPVVKMQHPGGVYEVTGDGMTVKGNIYDQQVDIMNQNGFKWDQSSNMVNLINKTKYSSTPLAIEKNGDFEFKTSLLDGKDVTKFTLDARDYAQNGMQDHPNFSYTLVKKGLPYAKLVANKNDVKYGENVTLSLSTHNIKDLTGGEFTLTFPSTTYDITNVSVNKDFTAYAKSHGLNTDLKIIEQTTSKITINTQLTGDSIQPIQTSIPLIDIKFKVKEKPTNYIKWIQTIDITKSTAFSLNQAPATIQGFGQGINVVPTYSQLEGGILADGFLDGIWLDYNKDFSKAGMTLKLVSKSGKTYTGEFNSSARYFVKNLPASNEEYDLTVKIPGHFDRHVTVNDLYDITNGDTVGRLSYILYALVMGGDVNNDNVIDVLDADYIKTYWGTNKRAADINFDGIVDTKDMSFVQKNYLTPNPDVKDVPKGKKIVKGETLENILKDLDIQ
ncbi:S8 family serine peptidase [Bacillus sp. AFS041924]|uniref:S8 family serine peptidase n=1 Tax=Bacillus sp. AFS041924 TaxID=2033503 RepID=UPI001145DE27|nr:S8 family serine peptidase [Bacillus sp. AFS041924]